MPAKVIAIGLDAAEATLIDQWSAAGHLPAFARLAVQGSARQLSNSLETLPGAIWPELTTGVSCGKAAHYYHPGQLHTGEMRARAISPAAAAAADSYWAIASRAGRRVAAVDQVQTVPVPGIDAIQVCEWGLHDRNFAIASEPPHLIEELIRRYGDHPVQACDRHGQTPAGYRRLLTGLLAGVERKTDLLLDLLGREDWDLFTSAYGESHCVGHQFWHFFDGASDVAPAEFRNAIRDVYARIDAGIGRLIEAAGPAATVLVYTSHGMGPYVGGYQLLPEVLVRMKLSSGGGSGLSSHVRRLQKIASHAPRPVQPWLRRLAHVRGVRDIEAVTGCLLNPLESPRTRAAAFKNNRCGAIRINQRGREPNGSVTPGAESDALIKEIREELANLEDPSSGEPIVARTITAVEAFGPDHHPDVPDLMVVFRTDLGCIESCRSERVGEIRVPLFHPNIPRTGDHTVNSRIWIAGSDIAPDTLKAKADVLDLAPTVLSLLGVPIPAHLDGTPMFGVATAA